MAVIERGRIGETYNVGGGNERNNRDVVGLICDTLDCASPRTQARLALPHLPADSRATSRSLITYVTDRPGHDHRYAIDATKLAGELGNRCSVISRAACGRPSTGTSSRKIGGATSPRGAYKAWIDKNYGFRIAV